MKITNLVPEFPMSNGRHSVDNKSIIDNYDFSVEPNVYDNYIYLSTKYGSDTNDDHANNYIITPDNLIDIANMLRDIAEKTKAWNDTVDTATSILDHFYELYDRDEIRKLSVSLDKNFINDFENKVITEKTNPMYGRLIVIFEYETYTGEHAAIRIITDSCIINKNVIPTKQIENKIKEKGIACDLDIDNFEKVYNIIQNKIILPENEKATNKIINLIDEMMNRKK